MKLAIPSTGESLQSPVDPRFGRTKYLVLADDKTNAASAVNNSMNLNAAQGVGIQAAKAVIDLGAKVLITGHVTGHVGPKAFAALQAGGVAVYPIAGGTVSEALEQFRTGVLKVLPAANVEGHG